MTRMRVRSVPPLVRRLVERASLARRPYSCRALEADVLVIEVERSCVTDAETLDSVPDLAEPPIDVGLADTEASE